MKKKSVGLLELETAVLECFLEKTPLSPLGVKIRGFECGIGVFKRGGPLHSTGVGMLNHQTSKIRPNSFWSQNFFVRVQN
jgi:hypothetical protein